MKGENSLSKELPFSPEEEIFQYFSQLLIPHSDIPWALLFSMYNLIAYKRRLIPHSTLYLNTAQQDTVYLQVKTN